MPERQKHGRTRRKQAEKLLSESEAKLEKYEKRKTEIIELLSVGGVQVDFAELNRELSRLKQKISAAETAWEGAAGELEEIRLENEKIHQES